MPASETSVTAPDVAGPPSGGGRRPAPWWALRVSVVPWVVARVLVGVALGVAHGLAHTGHISAAAKARVHEGLLGWDAGWYQSIAGHGYAGAGHDSLRFFPLFPALARGLSVLPGVGVGPAVVVVANLCALAGTAVLVALVRHETGDQALAGRTAWLLCLAPAAFTFVMGYAEGTLLVLAAGTFYALRTRHWWWAAALGLAAGLTRPLGALLFLPAAVEAGRALRSPGRAVPAGPESAGSERDVSGPVGRTGWVARAAAVLAPVAGTGVFLGWVGWRYGDALTPLRLQQEGVHHGRFTDPLVTLAHDASYLAHGHHLDEGLHLPWVLVALALLVVTFRAWPASYGLFAAAVLAVALAGSNLDSFERYALSAFPLVLAGATLTASPRVLRIVLVLSGAGLVAYAVLAFTNFYVP